VMLVMMNAMVVWLAAPSLHLPAHVALHR